MNGRAWLSALTLLAAAVSATGAVAQVRRLEVSGAVAQQPAYKSQVVNGALTQSLQIAFAITVTDDTGTAVDGFEIPAIPGKRTRGNMEIRAFLCPVGGTCTVVPLQLVSIQNAGSSWLVTASTDTSAQIPLLQPGSHAYAVNARLHTLLPDVQGQVRFVDIGAGQTVFWGP